MPAAVKGAGDIGQAGLSRLQVGERAFDEASARPRFFDELRDLHPRAPGRVAGGPGLPALGNMPDFERSAGIEAALRLDHGQDVEREPVTAFDVLLFFHEERKEGPADVAETRDGERNVFHEPSIVLRERGPSGAVFRFNLLCSVPVHQRYREEQALENERRQFFFC